MTAEYLRSLGLFRRANKRYLLTASVNIAIVSTAELQAIKRDVYMSVCLSVRVCVARIPLVLETLIAPVIPPCGVTFTRLALRRLVLRHHNRVSHVLQPCSFSVVYLYWKLNAGSRAAKLTRFLAVIYFVLQNRLGISTGSFKRTVTIAVRVWTQMMIWFFESSMRPFIIHYTIR